MTYLHTNACLRTYAPQPLVDADGHGASCQEEGAGGEEPEGGEEHGEVAGPEKLVQGVAACVGV